MRPSCGVAPIGAGRPAEPDNLLVPHELILRFAADSCGIHQIGSFLANSANDFHGGQL